MRNILFVLIFMTLKSWSQECDNNLVNFRKGKLKIICIKDENISQEYKIHDWEKKYKYIKDENDELIFIDPVIQLDSLKYNLNKFVKSHYNLDRGKINFGEPIAVLPLVLKVNNKGKVTFFGIKGRSNILHFENEILKIFNENEIHILLPDIAVDNKCVSYFVSVLITSIDIR